MENNKIFNIKGLYSTSLFELLASIIVVIVVIMIAFSIAFTEGLFLIIVALGISILGAFGVYCMYKSYIDFRQTGITIDIENNKFIYPIKTTIYNLNGNSIQEIHLSSIFAISAKDNVVRKSDGKLQYYYNISIQSSEIDYPISYSFYSSGNRDRLYSILKSVNGLD